MLWFWLINSDGNNYNKWNNINRKFWNYLKIQTCICFTPVLIVSNWIIIFFLKQLRVVDDFVIFAAEMRYLKVIQLYLEIAWYYSKLYCTWRSWSLHFCWWHITDRLIKLWVRSCGTKQTYNSFNIYISSMLVNWALFF